MKIVALEAENVKHLKAVRIEPDGSTIVIGGDNEQGKTSVLDSIEYALGGQANIPSKPIRNGQKKARIVVDLGEIEVTRTFTEKGTRVVVKNKDGATFASPQAMLDQLIGNLTFDPLEFSRLDAKRRIETLKKVVGLDFSDLDAQYKKVFEERANVNRQGKDLRAQFDATEKHDNVPAEEVSVSRLSSELSKAITHNNQINSLQSTMEQTQERLATTMAKIAELQSCAKVLSKEIQSLETQLKTSKLQDVQKLEEQIQHAEDTNKKVRANKNRQDLGDRLKKLRKQSEELSGKLDDIKETKQKKLADAKFPIKKLGMDSDEVVFDGIPFDQCSTAQKLKISVAMGLAMNPKLKVLLIREGSMLDSGNLKMIADMAQKADAQVWIERVSKGEECQVIIEDGEIVDGKA